MADDRRGRPERMSPVDARKLARFNDCAKTLACPVCGEPLTLADTSLVCPRNHRFDIARQGYANLLRGGKKQQEYDRASFENRRRVFASGLYDPIARALVELVEEHAPAGLVVDAGCGEGFFSSRVRGATGRPVCAFDISKDSVQLAAGSNAEDGIMWLVADLAAIPLQDGVAACVCDVFSPANYHEFKRVLAPDGVVVKVVPTENHLHELRARAAEQLRHDDYSNQRVLDHLAASCRVVARRRATSTLRLDADALAALVAMTPLLFHVDRDQVNWSDVDEVTVEADLIVGMF